MKEEITETQEVVILVDENDQELGLISKATVHTKNTPLHRAFSLYIFNAQGKVLLQQRNKEKITWGGFWSNSCCGHPGKGENREDTAKRRAKQELGIAVNQIEKIVNYRYRFECNNIVENEICPIFAGVTIEEPQPDPNEIENTKWLNWSEWLKDIENNPARYSPWSKEQVKILTESPYFKSWLEKNHIKLK